MTKWDYGEEGQMYLVKAGEVWQVGKHLFACSDLMASEFFTKDVVGRISELPTLLYCDPPWGQSLVNSFRTKAGLAKADYRWTALYRAVAAVGHSRGLSVWVEGSKPDSRDGTLIPISIDINAGAPLGQFFGSVPVTYYRKHAAGLYYNSPIEPPLELLDMLAGRDDEDTPGIVMSYYGTSGVVVDPCAGRGLTSRAAERVGWASVNNELNPARVSAALVRMSKLVKLQPMRVR